MTAPLLNLPYVRVKGSPATLGHGQGEAFRGMIQAFVDQRLRAARAYLYTHNIRDENLFITLGAQCLEVLKQWDLAAFEEHSAIAQAALVDPVALYTAGNMTDVRDILTFPKKPDGEGCSTALISSDFSRTHQVLAAQTWDLNPTDLDYVVAVQRNPTIGPRTWSITCCGCPSLIGMNEYGLCVGTTNIKTHGSHVGIPYMSVLHRALNSCNRNEAGRIYEQAPLAAAHSYWAADHEGVSDWECSPKHRFRRDGGPLCRTNHCLDALHRQEEGEAATVSSQMRLARLKSTLEQGKHTAESIQKLFADRSDGVNSINRYTEDGQGTTTNACFIGIPAERTLHACRGSSDRGAWTSFQF